jgi:DNA-binding CsgD family transcriptional regulator
VPEDESTARVARGIETLSPREVEVLDMTSLGLTNEELARSLNVTSHAIKFHLASIYRKLHVGNRTEAVAAYLRASRPGEPAAARQPAATHIERLTPGERT